MAVPTTFVFDKAKAAFLRKQLNIDTGGDTLKAILLTASYVPAPATHDVYADVSANEVAGAGYTAGGATVAGQAVTITAANSWTPWAAATAYAVGQLVRPTTGNSFVYRCAVGGTSHATVEPAWPTTVGQTVTDNGITWTCVGTSVIKWACTNPSWPSATVTARFCIIRDTTFDKLLFCYDFGANFSSTNGTFTAILDPVNGGFDLV